MKTRGFVRRAILLTVALLVGGLSLPGHAQQVHPAQQPHLLFGPHPPQRHAGSASEVAQEAAFSDSPTVVDATDLGSTHLLDKGWRLGVTSDATASNPNFDDSHWALRDAQESIADVPDDGDDSKSHARKYVWFRLHLKLAPNHGPVSLLVDLPVAQSATLSVAAYGPGLDVFANGKLIQPDGPHADETFRYQEISRIYHLNLDPHETNLTLVLRTMYIPFGYAAYTSFFSRHTLQLGEPEDVSRAWDLWYLHSLLEHLPRLVNAILLTVLSLFLLALYFTQRGHVEYLWLALHEFLQAPIGFVDLAGGMARIDQLWHAAVVLQLVVLSAYLYFEFLVAFLSMKRRWYIVALRWTAPILAGVGPTILFLGGHGWFLILMLGIFYLGSLIWIIGWSILIFVTLIVATLRRNFEAGLLLIPLLLTIVGIAEPILTSIVTESSGHPYRSPLTVFAGPIPIHFATIADFAGLLAIVLIIFVRFLRIQHDQERAKTELAAARSVQELMIPREKVATPGYEVDSVYQPATEVGGDFFHVQPASDGGLLVVIGDVAGHGLKAAMSVSMLMGALRRIPERGPAKILESLNRVLTGSESLTTCQAIWFGKDGELVMSSAGHPFPYLNSQEIALPGGLPLGAIPEVKYDEVRLYLHPGDRLLLLSDGVVEARKPSGELFGFDRVHNLSNQSAFYIADAAKEFGQEDDITVLTVRRLAEVMAA
jgi:phosphoserine phosphatase RsbU/P